MCEVQAVMLKNEQFARGWAKLYEKDNPVEAINMAQYALDVQKLRHRHEAVCVHCREAA